MRMPPLLGEIVEKDGMICLQTSPACWFPLGGSSAIAEEFRETYNEPGASDIGRRLYRTRGGLALENREQMDERKNHDRS